MLGKDQRIKKQTTFILFQGESLLEIIVYDVQAVNGLFSWLENFPWVADKFASDTNHF